MALISSYVGEGRYGTPKPQDVWTCAPPVVYQQFPSGLSVIVVDEQLATHLPDLQFDNRPRPSHPVLSHFRHHFSEPWFIIPLYHLSPAEKPHNPWAYFKGAKHDRHATVFVDMRHRLASGARGIDICRRIGRENGECGRRETFGGDINVRAGERS